jgi:peptidyl-prolyl cis-trans isomerase A (cyclophilin A)
MKRTLLALLAVAAIAVGVAAASGPSLLHPASLHAKPPAVFKAKFTTTKGSFVVTVYRKWAPLGAKRFYNLVLYHFYDNQPLYRVLPGFVVQWGINMNPPIAKAWKNAYINDDPPNNNDAKGTISFAHVLGAGAKNTRTTQVFVNLGANLRNLGPSFPAFGKITRGFSIFKTLYHGPNKKGYYAYNFQADMTKYGGTWVHTWFPRLDWIKTARIVH